MAKFVKIDREFKMGDSSVNCYGFRLLTKGYQLADYQRNPIGYYMHDRKSGVLVKWEDLAIKGDDIVGKPVVNMSNPRGQQTVDEIENGFLNAASFGQLVILEYSDDPALKLEGQTGPTVTKWYNRECSPVDIPGNFNALAALELFDGDSNPINLADFSKPVNFNMKQIFLTAGMLATLNLRAEDTAEKAEIAFNDLVAKAAKVDDLQTKLQEANKKVTDKDVELANLKSTATTEKFAALVDGAVDAKKIDAGDKAKYLKLAAADYDTTKSLIDGMQPRKTIEQELSGNAGGAGNAALVQSLMAMSGEELYEKGKFEDLKAASPEGYKIKFKAFFGVDPS